MAFDLDSAQPVTNSGFDLASAKPVDGAPAPPSSGATTGQAIAAPFAAARDIVGNIPGQMIGALAREISRAIPGADPNAVRDWILKNTTTHSDNPAAQQIEGAVSLPFTAAGKAFDKGVSMLPDALQPAAKGLGEVGSDVAALAPAAGAVRAGLD